MILRNVHMPMRGSAIIAAFIFAALIAMKASGETPERCFTPIERQSKGPQSMHVDPRSTTCRAIESALNARCGEEVPTAALTSSASNPRLTSPIWEEIRLFTDDGQERAAAFKLLGELVDARARAKYVRDYRARAQRDLTAILERVRRSRSQGGMPRFEMTLLDLEGRGHPEIVYRLSSAEPATTSAASKEMVQQRRFADPQLFLQRAVGLPERGTNGAPSVHASGNDITANAADIFLDDEIPHVIAWSSLNTVHIYTAYTKPDRPPRSNEIRDGRTSIVTALRCMFEYQVTLKN